MIKTLSKQIKGFTLESILAPFFMLCEVLFECLIPFIMAKLIDELSGNSLAPIFKYGIPLIVLAMLSLISGMLSGKYAATASCGFAKNLRKGMFYKIQDFSFNEIDKFSTSSLVTRMTTDVTNVQHAYQMLIRMAVRAPLMMIFAFSMSVSINWEMSLIFLAIIPILAVALWLIISKAHPQFKKVFKKYDALNNSVQENVGGIRVVKAYVREDFEKEKFSVAAKEVRDGFTKAEKLLALTNPIMMFCIYLGILLLSFIGSQVIINTAQVGLSAGELSSLINYGGQILSSLMMLSMVFVMITMAGASSKRIAEVLEQETTLKNNENGLTEVKDGSIVFENASFKYAQDAEEFALNDITLQINSGETIGIIGGTGASKTTFIQLISRLYDVSQGKVLVGGSDVRDYDLTVLRNSVAVVLQKNVLFSGTIRENLLWGNEHASDEELMHACKLAQAEEFIKNMPQGLDTFIEQGGTNVSGGQKQRLCIARALLKSPKVLILDDSTSAVDTKTDALIRQAFKKDIPHTTKLIIAQRIASVQESDKIIVLDNGKVVGFGTHEELLKSSDIYREVYISQNSNKEDVSAQAVACDVAFEEEII